MMNIDGLTPYQLLMLQRVMAAGEHRDVSDLIPLLLQAIEARDGILQKLKPFVPVNIWNEIEKVRNLP